MHSSYLTKHLSAFQVLILYHYNAINGVYLLQMINEISLPQIHRDFSWKWGHENAGVNLWKEGLMENPSEKHPAYIFFIISWNIKFNGL